MRAAGASGRENVGLSNRKSDENSDRRKPKVSLAMEISQGLAGPKRAPLSRVTKFKVQNSKIKIKVLNFAKAKFNIHIFEI